jgi:hypothetical protein
LIAEFWPENQESRRKYMPRHENVKIGIKRETCCWGGETIIGKLVCGQTAAAGSCKHRKEPSSYLKTLKF